MQNEQYANSYRQEAKKIKNQKIWKNFRIGGLVSLGLMLPIAATVPVM